MTLAALLHRMRNAFAGEPASLGRLAGAALGDGVAPPFDDGVRARDERGRELGVLGALFCWVTISARRGSREDVPNDARDDGAQGRDTEPGCCRGEQKTARGCCHAQGTHRPLRHKFEFKTVRD